MLNIPLSNILFLDIETVSQKPSYDQLGDDWQKLWKKKSEVLLRGKEDETTESVYSRAGIFAEFGKIICISCGFLSYSGDSRKFALKSFYGEDEKTLLQDFIEMLRKWAMENSKFLCAHNGREFDFPYLCRRLIINQLAIPSVLQTAGKKPWELNFIDTMELWKFGDFKNYTSLNLIAHALNIPTPKDDIDGSQVGDVYWNEHNLERIVTYCQKDVVTVMQVYLRLCGEQCIHEDNIEIK
ncbi:MAG: ribonuclease H-like domain-containing protein [Gemmatimonadaceae bacterium]|nr:ribonuclease H-like domain-containing protein [Chitinophagaceae bacterium]